MALANCDSDYWREMRLRMIFLNEVPPWEEATGGTPYVWLFTQFKFALNVADPGEAGQITTSPATYAGYGQATYNRGPAAWTFTGTGTANPKVANTQSIAWPEKTDAGSQAINAVSFAMIYSGTDYSVARDALAAPVDVDQFERPNLPSASFTVEAF